MGDLHFDCTMCGQCCHGLRLPLSLAEARLWLDKGGTVQLMCEAHPWPEEPADGDALGHYRRARTFAAQSGGLPVRIMVTLVAAFAGPCPFLLPDMRCGNYAERPRVCRIYPAEMNPFAVLKPAGKACPPEAWNDANPLLARNGEAVAPETVAIVAAARATSIEDGRAKERLCADLGIAVAALGNEGYVAHSPNPAALRAALAGLENARPFRSVAWTVASNRSATIAMLEAAGAQSLLAADGDAGASDYIGFFPAG
ncbi:YkgJ family cysteine cluster protein [Sphingomonas abietis]|uniref:YkgJ family cysteine cluster protein n=1 Tax=Sphingomonas abietis TaxID=3012344 RepID=A0ABY7NQW0_9SPHN|nr:YkgJ family cysteine cluster protein [Sphingomonas abietis]WBO23582.1 YkgJ family cysteine cluster protein [Sphingomonas abietis]